MGQMLEKLKQNIVRQLKYCDLIIHSQHGCMRNTVSNKENLFVFTILRKCEEFQWTDTVTRIELMDLMEQSDITDVNREWSFLFSVEEHILSFKECLPDQCPGGYDQNYPFFLFLVNVTETCQMRHEI